MSWFKKHFTCIRTREISDLDKNTVIQSIRNDLKSDVRCHHNNPLPHKNSNEYRDYTKNCEGKFLAQTFYNLNVDNGRLINQRVRICDKDNNNNNGCKGGSGGGWFGKKGEKVRHECDDKQCRVHSAMVSKINPGSRSVTVEWYERGETKGKEVELDMLLQLNPDLCKEALTPVQGTQIQQTHPPSQLQQPMIRQPAQQTQAQQHQPPPPANLSRNATQGAIRSSRLNNAAVNGRPSRIATTASSTNLNGQDHSENIPPQSKQRVQNSRMSVAAPTAINTGIQQNSGARRSYVVKEVERLKENREKRRARQAELKEEKNALMNQDPGNPNWELAAMIKDYTSTIEFRPLMDGQAVDDHQITVCVRKRPLSRKEVMKKELDVISVPTKDTLIVHEPKTKVDLTKLLENHNFRYDYALDDSSSNELVYKYTAKPLVKTIFEGGMATCFAYGQTGSGKTHTMGGAFNGKLQDCKNGIYAMAAQDVFALLRSPKYNHQNFVVSASFFEIYSGKVFDLLADKLKLKVLEDGKQQVQIVGLTERVVDSVEDVLRLIQHGNATRTSGQTSANANSSRSHAVFQIVLRPQGANKIHGKFSFIDLAGNERGADTSSANRQTRMEGAEINKSLLALKECIRALGKQNAHLPFRASKLTQVLRDSFIGEKSKTCMIAMISPGLSSCEHTLNTLRYANRVKELVAIDPSERSEDDEYLAGGGGEPMEMNDDHKNNGQLNANDLAQLRSLNFSMLQEHDMSVELYNQHAAISDLQQTEEELVDQHKIMNEFLAKFLPESRELYSMTNYVDYDQDAYCKRGEELFTQLADLALACKELMGEFRSKLTKEEILSANIKHTGKR